MRAARTAGTKVAATATPSATPVTRPTVEMASGGAPAPPRRPAAGIGEQWGGQPADREPGRCREQGHDDVLGEEHGSDQARCAADRFEQSDASDLVGHSASDEDGDAGQGEQDEQPAAGQQGSPLVPDQGGGLFADLLPGLQERGCRVGCARARRCVLGRVVLVDERRGCGRVGQLQVQDVGDGFILRGKAPGVRPAEPDQAGGHAEGKAGQLRIRRRGGGDRDADDPERPASQGDRITGADAERVGEGGLDHHPAGAHQLPWVSLGWSIGADAVSRPSTRAFSVWPCATSLVQTTGYGPL